jgi:protein regulator of cytokinesis 1
MRPLLKLVQKRVELQAEKVEFEKSQQDPNRFKIAGRMIQEEKQRKRLAKLIPQIEGQLKTSIPEWEQEYGAFLVDGSRYLETMDAEENQDIAKREELKAEKEREKVAKRVAAAQERSGTMPSNVAPIPLSRPGTAANDASLAKKNSESNKANLNAPSHADNASKSNKGQGISKSNKGIKKATDAASKENVNA